MRGTVGVVVLALLCSATSSVASSSEAVDLEASCLFWWSWDHPLERVVVGAVCAISDDNNPIPNEDWLFVTSQPTDRSIEDEDEGTSERPTEAVEHTPQK